MATLPIPNWFANPVITDSTIVLPSNIIYKDSNGNNVYKLYPYNYLVLIGQDLNNTITQLNAATAILSGQTAQINYLYSAVATIPAPYHTPQVSPQCLGLSGTTQPIDTLLSQFITNWCNFIVVMGTNNNLLRGVATQCANLNTSPSYGHPGSSLGALPGWINSPTTVADTLTNMWLTICDNRSGVQTVVNSVTPTCSQVIIGYSADIPTYQTGINVYLDGYTFIPAGFTDNGSTIKVVDNSGNIAQLSINVVTQSTSSTPFNIPLTGSTLLPNSNYTIYLNSTVTDSALGLTCVKTTVFYLTNNNITCPSINIIPGQTSMGITLYPYITSNVIYTVNLLGVSGTTLQSAQFSNPNSVQSYTFFGLTSNTPYAIQAQVAITNSPSITCPIISVSTTS